MNMKAKLNINNAAWIVLCALTLSPTALFAGNTSHTATESGIIKSVDNNAHQIVVIDQKTKAEGTFHWNDHTKFTEHHEAVNTSSLKEGLAVHITYKTESGTALLEHVKLTPPKAQTHTAAVPDSRQKP
jgi:hypothetical protein